MKVEVSPVGDSDDLFNLRTVGLVSVRRRELEIVNVRKECVGDAGALINVVADYTANTREVKAGELWGMELSKAHLIVRLLEPPANDSTDSVPPPKKGLFARMFGGKTEPGGPLRIVAPHAEASLDEAPSIAMATVILDRASRLLKEGHEEHDAQAGRAELERGIRCFPGNPAGRDEPDFSGASHNTQNYLTYLELSRRSEGSDSDEYYLKALQRSASLEWRELGAAAEDLTGASASELRECCRDVIEHNLNSKWMVERVGPSVAIFVSPLWMPGEEGTINRRATLLPILYKDLYYEGQGEALLTSPSTVEIAAEVISRHANNVHRLLLFVRDTREAYLDPSAPWMEQQAIYHPPHGILSALLADIVRLGCADASEREIRAHYGLVEDEQAARSCADRLAEQRSREHDWRIEALSAGMAEGLP